MAGLEMRAGQIMKVESNKYGDESLCIQSKEIGQVLHESYWPDN